MQRLNPEAAVIVCGCLAQRDGEKLLSAGGRVLGVTAVADTLDVAIQKAYDRVSKVSFENGYYRSDIGARAMKALQK